MINFCQIHILEDGQIFETSGSEPCLSPSSGKSSHSEKGWKRYHVLDPDRPCPHEISMKMNRTLVEWTYEKSHEPSIYGCNPIGNYSKVLRNLSWRPILLPSGELKSTCSPGNYIYPAAKVQDLVGKPGGHVAASRDSGEVMAQRKIITQQKWRYALL